MWRNIYAIHWRGAQQWFAHGHYRTESRGWVRIESRPPGSETDSTPLDQSGCTIWPTAFLQFMNRKWVFNLRNYIWCYRRSRGSADAGAQRQLRDSGVKASDRQMPADATGLHILTAVGTDIELLNMFIHFLVAATVSIYFSTGLCAKGGGICEKCSRTTWQVSLFMRSDGHWGKWQARNDIPDSFFPS